MRRMFQWVLNLITPLKIVAGEGAIKGCSEWWLRWHFSGKIVVGTGNSLVLNIERGKCDIRRKNCYMIVTGERNRVEFDSPIHELHPHLEVGGCDNEVRIGGDFKVFLKEFVWHWFGKNNRLVIGKNSLWPRNNVVHDGFDKISMGGENCSIEIGDRFAGRLNIVSAVHDIPFNWHFTMGDDCSLTGAVIRPNSICNVTISDRAFISWDFYIWCGSHAIVDDSGECLNECKGVFIGKNCWFGHGVEIPGTISVADNCVVGSHVVLARNVKRSGSIVSLPRAEILDVDVKWVRESPVEVRRGMRRMSNGGVYL